ncbi:hypothetical protein CLPUN_37990 [Clostridium puniceum]|uniref:Uncharacterized protein n=1 Tax=Clostridium puniceum TaxID=29367 RepID=A0A1S8T9Z4_9CLOT|nr:hypothetical protein [Clostridium puniceum]OOM74558.1 hypothetical protein CLPUN_37990 [Clostridium puniceum]
MGKLAVYAAYKDKLNKDIADETRRLCLGGLTYQAALRKAKELYIGKERKRK